jgi:hypothetical protein
MGTSSHQISYISTATNHHRAIQVELKITYKQSFPSENIRRDNLIKKLMRNLMIALDNIKFNIHYKKICFNCHQLTCSYFDFTSAVT